jgi:hypothetical protein
VVERFDEFQAIYREIERLLRAITGRHEASESFMGLMRIAREKSRVVSRHYDFLRTINDLRNVLVHKGGLKGETLAEPTEQVIRKTKSVAELLMRPPPLPKHVFCTVRVFDMSDLLGNTLQFMQSGDYSQVPIAAGGEFAGLLTTNAIALWLARNVDDEIVDIKSTPLSDLAGVEPPGSAYRFCTSKASCEAVIAVFDEAQEKGELLQAVLLTDNGRPGTDIRGIVTVYDLGKLYAPLM